MNYYKLQESNDRRRELAIQLSMLEKDYNNLLEFMNRMPHEVVDEALEKLKSENHEKYHRDIVEEI